MSVSVLLNREGIESLFTDLAGEPSAVNKVGEREFVIVYKAGSEGYEKPASSILMLKKEGSKPRFTFHDFYTTDEKRVIWVEQVG